MADRFISGYNAIVNTSESAMLWSRIIPVERISFLPVAMGMSCTSLQTCLTFCLVFRLRISGVEKVLLPMLSPLVIPPLRSVVHGCGHVSVTCPSYVHVVVPNPLLCVNTSPWPHPAGQQATPPLLLHAVHIK